MTDQLTESKNLTEQTQNEPSKYSKEELLTVFDEIIFSGEYREDALIKGKLKVTFRSRSADDVNSITREMDNQIHNLVSAYNERVAFLNVVYSVISYAGKDLSGMGIDDKKAYLGKLPAVIIAALSEALVKFDSKVAEACIEGEENF